MAKTYETIEAVVAELERRFPDVDNPKANRRALWDFVNGGWDGPVGEDGVDHWTESWEQACRETERGDGPAKGFVRTPDGQYFVQLPADNGWGFVLADDDQTWDFPPVREWELVPAEEVPAAERERLGWLLEGVE
jgi:hypothetical protein